MKNFIAEILKPEKYPNAAYVSIPFDVKKAYGKANPKVKIHYDGILYRGMISNMGFGAMCIIPKEIREKMRKTHGDQVFVEIELDLEERVVEIPESLAFIFNQNPKLKHTFSRLSYTKRKELCRSLTDAKKEETKIKRLAKAVAFIKEKVKK